MAVQSNIINDLCTYTRVPNKIMTEIISKETMCIGSAIHDAMLAQEDVALLNIGIGTLSIDLASRQCKFLPSRELKSTIKKSLDEKVDPIELELEQAAIEKLMKVFNEVM